MRKSFYFKRIQRTFERFRSAAVRRIAHPYSLKKNSLIYWRAHILLSILAVGLILGFFVILVAMPLLFREEAWGLAAIDVLGYLVGLYLLFSKRLRFEVRSMMVLLIFYALGMAITIFVGPLSAGPFWLFAFAVLAGLFNGIRAAFGAILLNTASLFVLASFMLSGIWGFDFPFFNSTQALVAAVASFILLKAVIAVSVAAVVKGLVSETKKQEEATLSLKHERLQLLRTQSDLENEIKERRQVQQQLSESEEKYRRLFELESDAILVVEKESCAVIEANEAAVKMYGYSREELLSLKNTDLSAEPEKTRQATQALSSMVLLRNHRRKDGNVFPVEVTKSHLTWYGRSVDIAAIRDISFRIEAESERQKLERELFQARKMESIGTLAGGIAHDFNNILFMITGNAEMAMEDILPSHPAFTNLNEIKKAGIRAAGIIRQLLNFSRRTEIAIEPIDVIPVIEDALGFLRSTIPSTIEIRKTLPDGGVTISADPIQISQVMMNLCSNAAHAMEDNGGVLEIDVAKRFLADEQVRHLPDLSPGEHLHVKVSDTGHGISTEVLDRIFEPYFTLKEVGKGIGMGLTIVLGIVKNHHGAITVQSRVGAGTTIDLFFPVAYVEPVPVVEDNGDPPRGSGSILFVDDEEAIARMTQKTLERLGYTVETRTNPLDALALFRSRPDAFDLVITDMTMPQMTGSAMAKKMKQVRPDIPIIICTGYSASIDQSKSDDLGFVAYIMKPISRNNLAKIIHQALNGNRKNLSS